MIFFFKFSYKTNTTTWDLGQEMVEWCFRSGYKSSRGGKPLEKMNIIN